MDGGLGLLTGSAGGVGLVGIVGFVGMTSDFGVVGVFCSGEIVTTACATDEGDDGLGVGAADMRRPFISTGFMIRDENREIPFAKQHQSFSLA